MRFVQKQYFNLVLIRLAIIAFIAVKPPHWQTPQLFSVILYVVFSYDESQQHMFAIFNCQDPIWLVFA